MFILREGDVTADIAALDRAWSQSATFVFLPDRSAVSTPWIETALATLPPEFHTKHFALLTSGSTGEPKLVVGCRRRAEELTSVLLAAQDGRGVRQTAVTLPLTYCYAFVNQWLWARQHAKQLLLTPGFGQPDRLKAALHAAADAMLCLVPTQLALLSRHFASETFPGIIRVHFAGGRFPQEQLDVVRRFFPHAAVFNNYGCAEAMPRLTLRRAEEGDSASDIGVPLPGIELNRDDNGVIVFRSPYAAVAQVAADRFRAITSDMWVSTGDFGTLEANGHWHLTGRAQEVFKRHGEKITLPLLLSTVSAHWPGQATFYREIDAAGEEGHVLILAPQPSADQLRNVLRGFRAHHPRAQWPLRIEGVETLPSLPNGKIDRLALPGLSDKIVHWHQRISN